MKLTYNIFLPILHTAAVCILTALGYSRLLAWNHWFWYNDLFYFLIAALILVGHQFLLQWGHKKQWNIRGVIRGLGAVDYILFSLQLVLTGSGLVWEAAGPLLRDDRTFSRHALVVLLPIMAVDITAMALRKKSTARYLYIAP